jgi:hypothetical protein
MEKLGSLRSPRRSTDRYWGETREYPASALTASATSRSVHGRPSGWWVSHSLFSRSAITLPRLVSCSVTISSLPFLPQWSKSPIARIS